MPPSTSAGEHERHARSASGSSGGPAGTPSAGACGGAVRVLAGRSRRRSASSIGFPGRRNQYASTGTIVSATNSEATSAIVTVSANGRNSSPVMSPTNAMRQEHGDGRDGGGGDRARHLAHRAQDRVQLVGVADDVPLDVLDDDDRVVDHAADRDRERAEGEDVERVAERLHADEGDQHAGRDRDRGDERRADRQQEDQDDEHGEDEAEQALGGERLDRLLDERRLVEDDGELGAVPREASSSGSTASTPLETSTVLRGRQLGDRDGERRLAVDARDAGDRVGCSSRRSRRRRSVGPDRPAPRRTARAAARRCRRPTSSFAPACTVRVWPSSVISPPGSSTPFCVERVADRLLREARRRPAPPWSGVIVTRWPVAPTIAAALTPSTSSISGMTDALELRLDASAWSSSPVTASWMTGKSSMDAGEHLRVDARRAAAPRCG